MRFVHPAFLWMLAGSGLLLIRGWLTRRRYRRPDAAAAAKHGRIQGDAVSFHDGADAGMGPTKIPWRFALGFALLAAALARPQWGLEPKPSFNSTKEIILALDISRSMAATDVSPSRLARAKKVAADLVAQLDDQRVGLIIFSRVAILQSPVSVDHDALRQFLSEASVATGNDGGTNYRNLLAVARDAFSAESTGARHLIILSDGEANDENWEQQISGLRDEGIVVVGLGIGTRSGTTIEDGANGPLRDPQRAIVVTRLETGNLEQLASATGGAYADATGEFAAGPAVHAILAHGAVQQRATNTEAVPRERFQWMLAPAALLLAWSLWREFPIRVRAVWRTVPSARTAQRSAAVTAGALLLLFLAAVISPRAHGQEDLSDVMAAQLNGLVGLLATRHPLKASDYAILAETSLNYGHWCRAEHHPVASGIVRDGLTAIEDGRKLDPKAADWDRLESSLRDLLLATPPPRAPPPPPARSLAHPPPLTPENAALLEKLQQIRNNDSAVRLYELLHPPVPADAAENSKNW